MLTTDTLKGLYREMVRIRLVEETIADLYPEQEMRCPVHLCAGQEAIAVGVCANLKRTDYVLSTHRSHGHYLAKGGDLRRMLAELYGRATGCCGGRGGSMHLVDISVGFLAAAPIVASTIPIAVGCAFGTRMLGEERITAVFFGDAATEEGVFHEAANFASLHQLPIVFICENNGYSVDSPLSVRQPRGREIIRLIEGHAIPSFEGDGNNVLEVCRLSSMAVQRARDGAGPTALEFKTERWREHCGPNQNINGDKQLQGRSRRCPIKSLKDRLLSAGDLSAAEDEQILVNVRAEIANAFEFAKRSSFPEPDILPEALYAS